MKKAWISNTEYDPSDNSNSSFHAGADISNLLFLYDYDKATYLSLLFQLILSERLANSLWGSDVFFEFLFSELKNIISILIYDFIDLIILLYPFLVISFVRYRKYIIFLISFSKFLDVWPAFTCASAIGNLWRICLGANILNLSPFFAFCFASDTIEE